MKYLSNILLGILSLYSTMFLAQELANSMGGDYPFWFSFTSYIIVVVSIAGINIYYLFITQSKGDTNNEE